MEMPARTLGSAVKNPARSAEAAAQTAAPGSLPTSALGLGCMAMSDAYGPSDRTESIATIHAALDAGIKLLDTGDFYGSGHNELLLREALKDRPRDSYQLSVKFGALRDPAGAFIGIDNRPVALKSALTYTLQRLGTDHVDIYRPARLDPAVPIEDTIGAIADMIKAGYVRHIGLSEVGAETLRRAQAVHPIVDLQIEYAIVSRGIEDEVLPTARELGIGITAYGILSRGLIGGHFAKDTQMAASDFRRFTPRFAPENLERNMAIVDTLRGLAEDKGVTVAQLAIAWVLARGSDIVPLVGARRRERLREALGALAVSLSLADISLIEQAVPKDAIAGDRYPAQHMAHLDSERKTGKHA